MKTKIAILYICTGKYNTFFADFYQTAEEFLFVDDQYQKTYFVWTDDISLTTKDNVHLIYKQSNGFPADSLFKFEMFLSVKEELENFDYIYFFNANTKFLNYIDEILIPNGNVELIAAEWPGKRKPFKHPIFYPYERNKKSKAYIAPGKYPYIYYMGGINGGTSKAYLDMIDTCAKNIRNDYENGIIACVHDESHINYYLRNHLCKVLTPEYCWPEEWCCKFKPKLILRDKVKVDPYFNKGRDNSFRGKFLKLIMIFYRAIKWYF